MSLLDDSAPKSDDIESAAAPVVAAASEAVDAAVAAAKPAATSAFSALSSAASSAAASASSAASSAAAAATAAAPVAKAAATKAATKAATTIKGAAAAAAATIPSPPAASKPATATTKVPTKSPAKPVLIAASTAKKAASPKGAAAPSPKAAPGTVAGGVAAIDRKTAVSIDQKHLPTSISPSAAAGAAKPAGAKVRACKHCKYTANHTGRFCNNCGRSLVGAKVATYPCKHCKLISVVKGTNCPNCRKAYGTAPPRKELGPCDNHNDAFAYQNCSNCDAKVCDTCVSRRDPESGSVICVECAQQGEVCDYLCCICSICATTCDKAAKIPTDAVVSPSKSASKTMKR